MAENSDNRPQGQEEYDNSSFYVAPIENPPRRDPPDRTPGAVKWLRDNLFSSALNSLLTVIVFIITAWALWGMFSWAIFDAEWNVVTSNLRLLMVGQYDVDQLWRVNMVGIGFTLLCGLSLGLWYKTAARPFFITSIIIVLIMLLIPALTQPVEPPAIRYIVGADTNTATLLTVADEGQELTVSLEQITLEDDLGLSVGDGVTLEDAVAENDGFAIERRGYVDINATIGSRNVYFNDVVRETTRGNIDLAAYDLQVDVRILDAEGNVLDSEIITPDNLDESVQIVAPATSWYQVEFEQLEGSTTGYAWLRLDGFEALLTRPVDERQRLETYGEAPDCADDTCLLVARRGLRFESSRTLAQYFSVQLAPFFSEAFIPTSVGLLATGLGIIAGMGLGREKELKERASVVMGILWLVSFPLTWFVLYGIQGNEALPLVATAKWGGLLLTLILTFVSIAASLPLSVILALGRDSDLPVVSVICTTLIEVVRGVPLITILFFAMFIVPFFSSALVGVDDVIRMLIGLTIFTAAYQAEVIRGGLQIVPKGQIEAAKAIGLSSVQTMYYIVMPQAIRAVIPAMMSQFVSLFKDTTLVSIVGLFELLGIVDFIVNGQQINRPFQREAYIFVGIIYFVVAYVMSQISKRLEESGSGAVRR